MPILDSKTYFCDGTSLGTSTGTAAIGTVIDIDASPSTTRDIAAGKTLYLVIQITEAVSTGSSPTVDIQLRSAAAVALTSSPTIHYSTGATAAASLTTAFRREIALPPGAYQKKLGIVAVIATAAITTGKVTAYLTDKPRQYTSYDDNVSSDV